MKTKVMMTTASTAALVVGGGHAAFAQDGFLPEGYTLNVQGGYGLQDNVLRDKVEASDSGGEISDEVNDKIGDSDSYREITGSVSLSRQMSPALDLTFGLGGGLTVSDEVSTSDGDFGPFDAVGTRSNFSFGALDLEAGYTVPTGAVDVRAFAGVRALASNSEIEKFGEFDSGGGPMEDSIIFRSIYAGIGPRVGVGFETQPTPVGTAGTFSLTGELAGSYLFGRRADETQSGGEVSGEQDGDMEVTTLEAQLGVNYHIAPNAKVTVGYELQQFWNVDLWSDDDEDTGFGDDADPRLVQGLFVGFTTTF